MDHLIAKGALPLAGAVNFRDMGGLTTVDARTIKRGILFRAAELTGLTETDLSYLASLQIRRIFDYRRAEEADRKPDPSIGSAVYERVSVSEEETVASNLFSEDESMKEYYRWRR